MSRRRMTLGWASRRQGPRVGRWVESFVGSGEVGPSQQKFSGARRRKGLCEIVRAIVDALPSSVQIAFWGNLASSGAFGGRGSLVLLGRRPPEQFVAIESTACVNRGVRRGAGFALLLNTGASGVIYQGGGARLSCLVRRGCLLGVDVESARKGWKTGGKKVEVQGAERRIWCFVLRSAASDLTLGEWMLGRTAGSAQGPAAPGPAADRDRFRGCTTQL